jgi:hypothetical protein
MKGIVTIILGLILSLSAFANSVKPADLVGIRLTSKEVIKNLTLLESTKVLNSLDKDQNIEIRNRVIYPEEVSQLITRKLTNSLKSGKKPNPNDYN